MRRAARIGGRGGEKREREKLCPAELGEVRAAGASLGQRSARGMPGGGRMGYRSHLTGMHLLW